MTSVTRLTLTALRSQLFRVADDLFTGRTDVVRLMHRDAPDDLVLVRAGTLAAMEQELATLRARLAPEPRPLFGYAFAAEPIDDILAGVRRDDATAAMHRAQEYAPMTQPPARVAERAPAARKPRRPRKR